MLTCGLDRHDNTQPIMTAHLACKDQSYWYVDWQWDGPIGGCISLTWTAGSERVNVNLMKWQERVWGQTHWWAAEIILLLPWQHHHSYCDIQQWSCRAVCVFSFLNFIFFYWVKHKWLTWKHKWHKTIQTKQQEEKIIKIKSWLNKLYLILCISQA